MEQLLNSATAEETELERLHILPEVTELVSVSGFPPSGLIPNPCVCLASRHNW